VIDEFQYVPDLVRAVKEVSDRLSPAERGKFLLTGSSDIFRSAKVSEGLPGHMARLELFPLALSEIYATKSNAVDLLLGPPTGHDVFDPTDRTKVAHLILDGGYPEPRDLSGRARRAWYESYVEGRVLKDFEQLHNTRGDYVSKLRALIPYLAGRTGNLLKYASVANDLDLNDGLVRSYIGVLDLMFIVERVSSWAKNPAKRETTRMPKLHFVDTGLACHVLGLRTPEQVLTSQFYGGLFESLLFGELKKQATWSSEPVGIYHFRDKRQNEVDLVLESDNGSIVGVEAKASSTVRVEDFKGLRKLAELAGERFTAGYVVYNGERLLSFKQDEIEFFAIPFSALF
jgi:predicted AAA+ superfamily ATPase